MKQHFDYLVIGGGSGGIASANRAALRGAKVALIEQDRLGGTCVNRGCVPKKVMWYAGFCAEVLRDAPSFGFGEIKNSIDWSTLVQRREQYIQRLNGLYAQGLEKNNVTEISGHAEFIDANTIRVAEKLYTAKHILIAVGGKPRAMNIPGEEFALDSDGFFELQQQPKNVLVSGGGYTALEIAGVLRALGSNVTLITRGKQLMRNFDTDITSRLADCMQTAGIKLLFEHNPEKIEKIDQLTVHCSGNKIISGFDAFISAVGREPNLNNLNLSAAGVSLTKSGHIQVDKFQNTTAKNIYAVGDVIGKVELTPLPLRLAGV